MPKEVKTGPRKESLAKAGKRKPPAARTGSHITTPQARKRGRWLSGLYAAKAPSYAEIEAAAAVQRGEEPKAVPTRANRGEFQSAAPMTWGLTALLIQEDAKNVPAQAKATRDWFDSWRMPKPNPFAHA